jgi:class 3 adenylate cyclase
VSFRLKILLAVFVPAVVLVGAAVAVALAEIGRASEEAARKSFDLTGGAIADALVAARDDLRNLGEIFQSPKHKALAEDAARSRDLAGLKQFMGGQMPALKGRLDYYAVGGPDGEILYCSRPDCPAGCSHDPLKWVKERPEALFAAMGGTFLGFVVLYDEAIAVLARDIRGVLEKLAGFHDVSIALVSGGALAYNSLEGWSPGLGREGYVRVAGRSHLAGRRELQGLGELILFRSLAAAEGQRRRTLAAGGVGLGLAFGVAAIVSALVSRGISRPVEALVEAARRVGGGDYHAQVDVRSRDELGQLGRAFNEMTEGLRKRRDIMEKTLSRDVAEELMKGTELGGERQEATILFMDVRGFTSASEGKDPADVVAMLNEMMERLAGAIHRHGGVVNKYLGDGLMAMFGAPKPMPGHATAAVRAGFEMQRLMDVWNGERVARRLPKMNIGIGINTGVVVGGKVGSRDRLEYTLIGEEVNLASRVCGKAAPGQVLITRQTHRQLGDGIRTAELEPIQVKGISYPVPVYEVQG